MKFLFLSLDTLRADRLSCLGNPSSLTPNLDRVASEGALFTRAFATDIPTQPSHTALFTGRFGINTGIVSHFHPPAQLDDSIPWLPSIMRDAGMATGAVDHLFAMKDWFVRGYTDYMPPRGRSRSPGSVINSIAFPWLDQHADQDFFLFLHYWDAHIPYLPPSPFKERFTAESATRRDPLVLQQLRSRPSYPLFKRNNYDHVGDIPNLQYLADLYDAEVAYLDFELGRLFAHLADLGILDETVVVIFGDHGEVMTEHDAWFDHAGLYDSVTHVPLIIRAPGTVPPTTVRSMVGLVDVMPTVLELAALPPVPGVDGRSLTPLMEGRTEGARPFIPLSEATWQAKRGIRTTEWKYIRCYDPGVYPRSGDELYNLADDPGEQVNVAARHPEVVTQLSATLDAWLADQLGAEDDPLLGVVRHGLPAVARLDGIINGTAAVAPSEPPPPEDASPAGAGLFGAGAVTGTAALAGAAGLGALAGAAAPAGAALVPLAAGAAGAAGEPVTAQQPAVTGSPAAVVDPVASRRRARRVRTVFVAAAVLIAATLLAFTIDSVFLQNPVQAAGVVAPVQTANLDLVAPGVIDAVYATPGELVHKGQILALGDTTAAQEKLAADRAKLASDQEALDNLSDPATPATVQQLAASVSTAKAELAEDEAKVTQVQATEQQAVQAASQQVQSDQTILANDEQTENADIPQCTGSDPPEQCGTDERQVSTDQATLAADQAALSEAQATEQADVEGAQQAVDVAEAQVSQAEANEAAGVQPGSSTQVADDKATVSSDKAQVDEDELALSQAVLRAPFTGVVAAVNGSAGETDTAQGVRQNTEQTPVANPTGSSIEIFPQQPQQATKATPTFAPLITLDSVSTQIVAQVPETQIASVHQGMTASISLPAVPGSDFKAKVTGIQPQAVNDSGSAYFLVELAVPDPPSSVVPVLPYSATGKHATAVSSEGRLVGQSANVSF